MNMKNQVSKEDIQQAAHGSQTGLGLFALGEAIERCFNPEYDQEIHLVMGVDGPLGAFRNYHDAERFLNQCPYPEEKEVKSMEIK